MTYVYSKFSRIDLIVIRLGGPGLANLLFGWANALAYAEHNRCDIIWPTWAQIKLSTITGRYGDRRIYWRLFTRPKTYIGGVRKFLALCFLPKRYYRGTDLCSVSGTRQRSEIIVFDFAWTQKTAFAPLFGIRERLRTDLRAMRPSAFIEGGIEYIAMHVRLGDLPHDGSSILRGERVTSHARLPLAYYTAALESVRNKSGSTLEVKLFSDGTEKELAELLVIEGVSLCRLTTAFDEMMAMSQASYLIASCSTFSKWASFLSHGITVWPILKLPFKSKLDQTREFEFNPLIGLKNLD